MGERIRRPLLLVAMTAALAVAPGAARAATFYVEDGVVASGNCATPATACKTILEGRNAARAAGGGPHTVRIAPGLYTEVVSAFTAQDDGLTFAGAGSGAPFGEGEPGTDTIIRPLAANTRAVLLGDAANPASPNNLTLRGVRVQVRAAAGGASGIRIDSSQSSLEDVVVEMQDAANANSAVQVAHGRPNVDGLIVRGVWVGDGIRVEPGALGFSLVDSTIVVTNTNNRSALTLVNGADAVVQRSVLQKSGPGAPAGNVIDANNSNLAMSSSLVLGAATGMSFRATSSSRDAVLHNVTIDAGTPKLNDVAAGRALYVSSDNGDDATVTLDSSIALEPHVVNHNDPASTSTITCSASDIRDQPDDPDPNETVACDAQADGNSQTPPGDLIVAAPAGSWKPTPTSPAIDTGSSAPLAPGESMTDLFGAGRVLDGDFDCAARRDKGAIEVTGQANTPPSVSITGPGSTITGTPAAFSAAASDEDPPAALAYRWTYSDGMQANGPTATRSFGVPGAAEARLAVTDSRGCVGQATHALQVLAPPAAPRPIAPRPVAPPTPRPDPPAGPRADRTPPSLSRLSLTPRVLRSSVRARVARRGRRPPTRARLGYRLSERARVVVIVERRRRGRRVGRRCVPETRRLRHRRRCVRFVQVGRRLRLRGRPGGNTARIATRRGARVLLPGRYRLRVVASDAAGNRSRERRIAFRVVR